jgi:hypothetical protein
MGSMVVEKRFLSSRAEEEISSEPAAERKFDRLAGLCAWSVLVAA